MCQYQPWEENPADESDYQPRENGRWETQFARLEARIANVEARVERLEARMLYLHRGMRFVCGLFLVTLVYAIYK